MLIEIVCNGKPRVTESSSVSGLLSELELGGNGIAVELNESIVPRTAYTSTPIASGDRVEIVHFVGGG